GSGCTCCCATRSSRGAAAPDRRSPHMRSPIAKGRVSSPYGNRGGSFHAGIDIAATGGYGTPVAAAFAGKVVKVVRGRKHGDRSRVNELAPYRTGNGVIIQNPDGERQLYGHVTPAVKVGQQVAEGELVGHVDDSGNTTGPHVHYEEWTRTGATRRSEEHTSELQSRENIVCRLL